MINQNYLFLNLIQVFSKINCHQIIKINFHFHQHLHSILIKIIIVKVCQIIIMRNFHYVWTLANLIFQKKKIYMN